LCDYPVAAQKSLKLTETFCDDLDTEITDLENWKKEYGLEPDKTLLDQHFCVSDAEGLTTVENCLQ
jgi:hypothetical protein